MTTQAAFDPVAFKTTTRRQWQEAADAWHRWGDFIGSWLGDATEAMIDLARHRPRAAGCSTSRPGPASSRCGSPGGSGRRAGCSPPTSRPTCSTGPPRTPRPRGWTKSRRSSWTARTLDTLARGSFDAVVSRVGLIYFPDQQRALRGALGPPCARRPDRRRRLLHSRAPTPSSRSRSGSSARRAAAPAAATGPAGSVLPGRRRVSWPERSRRRGSSTWRCAPCRRPSLLPSARGVRALPAGVVRRAPPDDGGADPGRAGGHLGGGGRPR